MKTFAAHNSSNISSAHYDEATGTLKVTFRSGRAYEYHGVPPEIYEGFEAADSAGGYFAESIRDQYRTRRV